MSCEYNVMGTQCHVDTMSCEQCHVNTVSCEHSVMWTHYRVTDTPPSSGRCTKKPPYSLVLPENYRRFAISNILSELMYQQTRQKAFAKRTAQGYSILVDPSTAHSGELGQGVNLAVQKTVVILSTGSQLSRASRLFQLLPYLLLFPPLTKPLTITRTLHTVANAGGFPYKNWRGGNIEGRI